jgi:hypothetical protein
LSSDFGFLYLLGSASGQAVADTTFVPFTSGNFVNTPSNTKLSVTNSGTSTAAISIADTGYYQVTYGVASSTPNALFTIKSVGGTTLGQQTLQTSAASGQLTTATCIVQVTTNPTTVGLANTTGSSVTLINPAGANSSVVAFISIIKLL